MPKSDSQQEDEVRSRRRALAKGLGAGGEMLRCSLIERSTVCGRPGCRCGRGEKHGPYLYVSHFDGKRSRHVYVPQAMEDEVRAWVRNYQTFSEKVSQISALSLDLIRLRRKGKNTSDRRQQKGRTGS